MIKQITQILLIIAAPLLIGLSSSPSAVFADSATTGASNLVCQGIGTASGTGGCSADHGATSINSVIAEVVNILTIIVGIAAVIMIVVAGFRFVVSGGDSANVASAKNSIIYVVVGLVVVALAQIIVHFVLFNVSKT